MTDLIDREALRKQADALTHRGEFIEYVATDALDAAPRILCRTCKHLAVANEWRPMATHWFQCGRSGCPAFNAPVDPDRFGCVCWEASDD